jgi:hypothetical protein
MPLLQAADCVDRATSGNETRDEDRDVTDGLQSAFLPSFIRHSATTSLCQNG